MCISWFCHILWYKDVYLEDQVHCFLLPMNSIEPVSSLVLVHNLHLQIPFPYESYAEKLFQRVCFLLFFLKKLAISNLSLSYYTCGSAKDLTQTNMWFQSFLEITSKT